MLSAYFVSDIHISSPECPEARRFVSFLVSLSGGHNITHLFLLGDIFDLWVADHKCFVDRYQEIIDELQRLRDEGVAISYFEGNHDLYLQYFWRDKLGLSVYESPAYVRLGNKMLRLEHGDQMDPDDKGYLLLRWLLRTVFIRILIRNLPEQLIRMIGERLSAHSRRLTSRARSLDGPRVVHKIHTHACRVHEEKAFDLLITGHVHVRDDCNLSSSRGVFRSVNLGSWLDSPCYFRLEDTDAQFFELNDHAKKGRSEINESECAG